MVGSRTIEVSNLDKVFFPDAGITKGDLMDYHERIADLMLPWIVDRPLSLKRYPDGIEGQSFFQKQAADHFPDWIRTAAIARRGRSGEVAHVVADEAATLVYLAQQGAIELHAGLAPVDDLLHPGDVIIDLDPPPGQDPSDVRRATRWTGDLLRELGLEPLVKASGSKGFHVHVLLDGSVEVDDAKAFAQAVAETLVTRHPERLTVEHRVAQRGGRIFVDWLRNGPAQTAIVPYSVRARPGAPVAAPLAWDELSSGVSPRHVTLRNVFRRLGQRPDPWRAADPPRTGLGDANQMLREVREE